VAAGDTTAVDGSTAPVTHEQESTERSVPS
jgi:hypothetical protein